MCGDSLTITEPSDEKHDSNLRITAGDILLANKITNHHELDVALGRVEELWGAQQFSEQGNELEQLADLICAYEGKSWDSYFNKVGAASDDLIADRDDIMKQKAIARHILSGTKVNNDEDDNESMKRGIDE